MDPAKAELAGHRLLADGERVVGGVGQGQHGLDLVVRRRSGASARAAARRPGRSCPARPRRTGRRRRSRGRAARLVGRPGQPTPPRTPGGARGVGSSCVEHSAFLRPEPRGRAAGDPSRARIVAGTDPEDRSRLIARPPILANSVYRPIEPAAWLQRQPWRQVRNSTVVKIRKGRLESRPDA